MKMTHFRTPWIVLIVGIAAATGAACGGRQAQTPSSQRLVDLYDPALVSGGAGIAGPVPRTEWRFGSAKAASAAGAGDWRASHDVAGLAERGAELTGRSTGDFPLISVERTEGLADGDTLHALEIRLRVSEGKNLAFSWSDEEKPDFGKMIERRRAFPWRDKTPIVAGASMRTYVVRPARPPRASEIRHLLLNPTDAPGASFEIESIRLIFRREYLAGIPSGVSWEGLSEVYRETLVARSPESIRFDLSLPDAPWLDLGLGTIENEPVTFRVAIAGAGAAASPEAILTRTLTTPHRWESARIDLSAWAGRKVSLSLTTDAGRGGLLGFWGSPAVRAGSASPASASAPQPRGVILIMADTLRRDHLDVYGYGRPTAPTLTAMAARGALFADCITQATWTKVATPTLMTSLYPSSHAVADFSDRLSATAMTLAEVYREAGAATLSMSSILFTGKFTNLHQGFEELHEDRSLADQDSSKTAREYLDRLLPWLESHRDVPFFVFLHVADPHDPFRPAPPYDTMWADASYFKQHEEETRKVNPFIEAPLLRQFEMPNKGELIKAGIDPDRYVGLNRDWYDGSIRAMDVEIGRLVEGLEELGLDRSTLIAFVGDHGEEFLEHGRTFHGQTVYGELSNVPLILWGAGVPAGRRVEQTVSVLDVMPTLLELSGLPLPESMQGRSLVSMMSGAGRQPDPAFVERAATTELTGAPPPLDAESRAVIQDGWKLIHNTGSLAGKPEFELYQQAADPLNLRDVAPQHPEIVAKLSATLREWRSRAVAARLKPGAESEGLSAEELERLRSLGYIQ